MTFDTAFRTTTAGKAILGMAAAVAMTFSVAATSAEASTVRPCTDWSVTTNGAPPAAAAACAGVFNKNGQPNASEIAAALNIASASLFALPLTWTDLGKIESAGGTDPDFSITGLGGTVGTWSITNPVIGAVYAFLMKGANDYAVYIPTVPGWNGTWTTNPDIRAGGRDGDKNVAALSNFSVFRAVVDVLPPPPPPPPGVVPLPAAGWLLLTGIGGLALLRRRKSA